VLINIYVILKKRVKLYKYRRHSLKVWERDGIKMKKQIQAKHRVNLHSFDHKRGITVRMKVIWNKVFQSFTELLTSTEFQMKVRQQVIFY